MKLAFHVRAANKTSYILNTVRCIIWFQVKFAVLTLNPLGKQTNLMPHLSFNRKMVLAQLAQEVQRRQHGS